MLAEVASAFSSLKAAKDMLQAFNGVQTASAVNDVKVALQGVILGAQQGLFAAQEAEAASAKRISELEDQIRAFRNWETEKQRYDLKRYYPGTLAYTIKQAVAGSEPLHHLCANCYQRGNKSILQATTKLDMRYRVHSCSSCRSEVAIGPEMEPREEV